MVKNQILPNNVQGKELINAFMSIKKELFVPKKFHDLVYSDADIMISEKRALIRTFIMAKMFEKCEFSKNDSSNEMEGLLKWINIVAEKLGISVDTGNWYRVLSNISENGGQEVPHLHFHLFGGEKIGKMVQ